MGVFDWLFGSKQEPTVTSQTTTNSLPSELKAPTEQMLKGATELYERKTAEGYQPYQGPLLAEFDPATTMAQEGLTALSTQGLSSMMPLASAQNYFAPALSYAMSAGQDWNPQTAERYMSPYIQSVVDIQKREAERVGDRQMQDIAAAGVGAGAYGGSRQAILEAEQMRNEGQLMNDIQQKGYQSAYDTGLSAFASDQARKAALAPQLANMGVTAAGQAATEMQNLANVGAQRQQQAQRGLDIDYQKYLQEQEFPSQTLREYSDFIRGVSRPGTASTITSGQTPTPSLASQLTGLAATGAGLYNAFKKEGGKVGGGIAAFADGGKVNKYDPEAFRQEMMMEWLANIGKQEAGIKASKESLGKQKWLELAQFGARLMSTPGNFAQAAGAAAGPSLSNLSDIMGKENELEVKGGLAGLQSKMQMYELMKDQEKADIAREELDMKAKVAAATAAGKEKGPKAITDAEITAAKAFKTDFAQAVEARDADMAKIVEAIPDSVLAATAKDIMNADPNISQKEAVEQAIVQEAPNYGMDEGILGTGFFQGVKRVR